MQWIFLMPDQELKEDEWLITIYASIYHVIPLLNLLLKIYSSAVKLFQQAS